MIWFWLIVLLAGVASIVWGAELFAGNLNKAANRLGVGVFGLAVLLAGAEPEELATAIAASARDAPGIAFGDIIGTNVAMCLVALGLGAAITPLRFDRRVFLYGIASAPVSGLSIALLWDGHLSRPEGGILVLLYVAYVATIWRFERAPPVLGEVEEFIETRDKLAHEADGCERHGASPELALLAFGLVLITAGSWFLVEAVRQITSIEETQTRLGLTLVGFATAFELVVLIWAAARRRETDIILAAVVGSFAYNMTLSLGAAALVRPIGLSDVASLRVPAVIMIALYMGIIALAARTGVLERLTGFTLLGMYPLFILWTFVF